MVVATQNNCTNGYLLLPQISRHIYHCGGTNDNQSIHNLQSNKIMFNISIQNSSCEQKIIILNTLKCMIYIYIYCQGLKFPIKCRTSPVKNRNVRFYSTTIGQIVRQREKVLFVYAS